MWRSDYWYTQTPSHSWQNKPRAVGDFRAKPVGSLKFAVIYFVNLFYRGNQHNDAAEYKTVENSLIYENMGIGPTTIDDLVATLRSL